MTRRYRRNKKSLPPKEVASFSTRETCLRKRGKTYKNTNFSATTPNHDHLCLITSISKKAVFYMTDYHTLKLPRMTVILTSGELVYLLQKDKELFKKGLARGKYALRAESKQAQYEKKFADSESQKLNDYLQ
jgi:hypothetical protein